MRPRQEAAGYTTAARAEALAGTGVDALLVNDPTLVGCPHSVQFRRAARLPIKKR